MGGPATTTWRGVTVDPTTAKALDAAASLTGSIYLHALQGSYTSSNANSSGTHSGGGAIDIDCTGLTWDQGKTIETALRRVGFAAWQRAATSYWKHHVHALRQDCGDLSSSARTQVGDYHAGYSGIPIGGRTNKDTGTRAYVDVTWADYQKAQEDDMSQEQYDAIMKALDAIPERVGYQQVGTTGKSLDTYELATNNWITDTNKKVVDLDAKVDANQAAVLAKLAELTDAVAALGKAPGA